MVRRLLLASILASIMLLSLGSGAFAANNWYVNSLTGIDTNTCATPTTACKSIGHAITLASTGDTINVAAATYDENLTIRVDVMIRGAGAATTIIDGGQLNAVVTVPNANTRVYLAGLTVENGFSSGNGGGINNSGTLRLVDSTVSGNTVGVAALGGGIYNGGNLTINGSTIIGNTSTLAGGGGGVANNGTLTISRSTISGNSTPYGGGGGVWNGGPGQLTITSSTITGNSLSGSDGAGGGIINEGTLTVTSSTINGNDSGFGGGIYNTGTAALASSTVSGNSGGIYSTGTATLRNTLIASNQSLGNCVGTIISDGHNLDSDGSCGLTGPGDLSKIDPKIGPLQNNGGPTQTQALLGGSPAIDAGDPSGCLAGPGGQLLTTDQRGAPQPDAEDGGVGCDIGAFERQLD